MEKLLVTWGEIAEYCGVSAKTLQRMKSQLIAEGIVFRRRQRLGKRIYCAWPDDIKKFLKK